MRRLLPTYSPEIDLAEAYAYPPGLADRAWVRANMVASVDGAATVDGRSAGLGGAADKQVFGVLRGLCDAVLVGAGTARTEGYRALRARPEHAATRSARGQPPAPVLVLVSGRLDLDPDSALFHGGAARTVVVTGSTADARSRDRLAEVAEVVVAGEDRVDVGRALDALAARGLVRVLCEGGPQLLGDVVAAGRLDELCVTVSPHLVGGDAPRIVAGAAAPTSLDLVQVLEQDGVLLARYVAR